MKLIIVVLALAGERYLRLGSSFQRFSWLAGYADKLRSWIKVDALWEKWIGYVVLVLPLLLVTGVLYYSLYSAVYGLGGLLIGLVILFYCLGPMDLYQQLQDYFSAAESAEDQGKQQLQAILAADMPTGEENPNRALTEKIFLDVNKRLFAVVFWFVVLGPVAAVLYRVTEQLRQLATDKDKKLQQVANDASYLLTVFDWVPVRIHSAIYSLVGNFNDSYKVWLSYLTKGFDSNQKLLVDTGLAALPAGKEAKATIEENKSAMALVDRSFVIFIVLIAVFTLGAWLY